MSQGSGSNNYVRALISNDYVAEVPGGVCLTPKGRAAAPQAPYPLDYDSVIARHSLMGKMNDMMATVRAAGPVVSRVALFDAVGMAHGGGSNNYVRHLLRQELLTENDAGVLDLPAFLRAA